MTADVEFIKGEGGQTKDFPIIDADGNTFDTSGYTAATLTLKSLDEATTLKTISCTIPVNGLVRWAMTTSDTNITFETGANARLMVAQIELTGTGVVKKTFKFSAYCAGSLT
jgi:hypothetical protein